MLDAIPEIQVHLDGVYSPKSVRLYGTLYRYVRVCRRQVWLQSRNISPDPDDDSLLIGRLIHEEFFSSGRYHRELWLNGSSIDVLLEDEGELIVMEVKRSASLIESYVLQLAFYMYLLRYRGLMTHGVLSFPLERRSLTVEWRPELLRLLRNATLEIEGLVLLRKPPPVEGRPWCRRCAYRDLCYE